MVFGKLSKKIKEKAFRNQMRALADAVLESANEVREKRQLIEGKASDEVIRLFDEAEKELMETHDYIIQMLSKKRIKIQEFVEMYHRIGEVVEKYCGKIAACDPEVGKVMKSITAEDIITGEALEKLEGMIK